MNSLQKTDDRPRILVVDDTVRASLADIRDTLKRNPEIHDYLRPLS